MIYGFYFRFLKLTHCKWLSILLSYMVRFLYICKYFVERLCCKKKTVNINHSVAIERISSVYPDINSKYQLVNLDVNDNVDLSIIVPIYNYVNLIEKNILSILNQKTKYSFELILVDDGSTDGAEEIVKKYSSNEKVKAIFQTNQGIAGARNTGLNNAVGKYIMFVDCDDIVNDNIVEILIDKAYSEDADIVMCAHNLVKENNGKVYSVVPNVYPDNNLLGYYGKAKILNYPGLPWAKVYKRELFSQVRYLPGYWYEDTIIHSLIFTQCKKFSYVPIVAYQYRWYENNFSHTQGNNTNLKCIDRYWMLVKILKTYIDINDINNECFYTMLIKHLSIHYYPTISGLSDDLIEDLFSLACDLFEEYRPNNKFKLPFMLRVTEKALIKRDIELWKLSIKYQ